MWLSAAGYETIHIGKFLNFYGQESAVEPVPGWSQWDTITGDGDSTLYYGFPVDDDGVAQIIPEYATDYLTSQAVHQIDVASRPFYLQLDYDAPHFDAGPPPGPTPAAAYRYSFHGFRAPHGPSFNEADVRDKPFFIRKLHPLTHSGMAWLNDAWRNSLRSLQSVDAGVRELVQLLKARGELGNTYIFFVSDNGFFFGQHRLVAGKYLPYEPSTHLPLLVRGPGIAPGSRTNSLVENIDLAPTFAALAGTTPTIQPDGQSLLPILRNPGRVSSRAVLLEGHTGDSREVHWNPHSNDASVTDYVGLVAGPWRYVHYQYGARELYDLRTDPEETENLVWRQPKVAARLNKLANRLKACSGVDCRARIKFGRGQ